MISQTLPLPSSQISQNGRLHYFKKAALVRQARELAFFVFSSIRHLFVPASAYEVSLHFHLNNRRKVDLDNLLARCKAYLDGLAAALGFNDSDITKMVLTKEYGKGDATVKIHVLPLPEK